MIDLHCHLLPGIDDGPETLEDALAMARLACSNGIRKAVITPHVHVGRYDNDLHSIRRHLSAFAEQLSGNQIPLEVDCAGEVRIDPEIMGMIEEGRIPFLGEVAGFRILLLEFPHGSIPVGSEKFAAWLLGRRIRPMIAHPERNKDVMRNVERLGPFIQMGCWLQVTAGSLTGVFGALARERGMQLLERGWVRILASDAHNLEARVPALEGGRAVAETVLGPVESWALVRDRPAEIIGEGRARPA